MRHWKWKGAAICAATSLFAASAPMALLVLDTTAAQKHIEAQMSLEEKRRLADYVIENNGSLKDLERQVREILAKIQTT